MFIEKIIKSLTGYDGGAPLHHIQDGRLGDRLVELLQSESKARWAMLCGIIEGAAAGIMFTMYYTSGGNEGPGTLAVVILGGANMAAGAVCLGAASYISSLVESARINSLSPWH